VALDLQSAKALRDAYRDMMAGVRAVVPDATIEGVIVRRMIPPGHEIILGAKQDAVFGPTLMFGLGGLFVEVFKDVTFALAPIGPAAARRMIRDVKAYSVLEGARGTAPADVEAICQSLLRLSRLVTDFPRIAELDINPLLVWPAGRGGAVADVRIRLDGETQPQ
jgi:acetyltransferase